jgi:hypothetical protein
MGRTSVLAVHNLMVVLWIKGVGIAGNAAFLVGGGDIAN